MVSKGGMQNGVQPIHRALGDGRRAAGADAAHVAGAVCLRSFLPSSVIQTYAVRQWRHFSPEPRHPHKRNERRAFRSAESFPYAAKDVTVRVLRQDLLPLPWFLIFERVPSIIQHRHPPFHMNVRFQAARAKERRFLRVVCNKDAVAHIAPFADNQNPLTGMR